MSKALITYTKTIEIDLSDPGIQSILIPELQASGIEGKVSADQIHDSIRDAIDSDPDSLLPSFDLDFDSNNITIVVDPAIEDDANAIIVPAPSKEETDE